MKGSEVGEEIGGGGGAFVHLEASCADSSP